MRYLYSLLFYLAMPFVMLRLWWRTRRSGQVGRRWGERLGFGPVAVKGCIWVHAVSLGETIAATPLIRALKAQYPDTPLLVTNMTSTGLQQTQKVFGDAVTSAAVPYDLPDVVSRFLKRVQPKILVVMETELWPNLFNACYRMGIPVVVANARLSEKSARGYQRIAPYMHGIFRAIVRLLVHAAPDEARFRALGMPADRMQVTGSLKYDLELALGLTEAGKKLREQLGATRPVWVAASTHPGEDTLVLVAHHLIRERFPEALLLLVPRHPQRFDNVAEDIKAAGFTLMRRSERDKDGEMVPADTAVYLADSFGEMMLMYAAADMVCVCGSFVPVGGHNIIEPAALNKPVVTGPQLFNFAEISSMMLEAGAMVTVTDAVTLADVITGWMADPAAAEAVGGKGFSVVLQNRGALQKQLTAVCEVVDGRI